mmetsp:Transcript_31127/g.41172  ORF Transcript_31127/g.41172 Transcript_31127/m.41172 type:complete len:215 (-) Transcript_31127:319-963(-)|eukprot:CAMPEP_0117756402 /NCGR_PEP_ID=MMETSP0947-20121206/14060_1 /TAXON_ID=44440 /ORGANISM="Chattonella subsalsa, Strain CCMP2191" /LENGTH=214 /DNA_ID=CAMNT_0005575989 /DNA_START=183 /DNA_END=827 /DNA_ORIENTATION=+
MDNLAQIIRDVIRKSGIPVDTSVVKDEALLLAAFGCILVTISTIGLYFLSESPNKPKVCQTKQQSPKRMKMLQKQKKTQKPDKKKKTATVKKQPPVPLNQYTVLQPSDEESTDSEDELLQAEILARNASKSPTRNLTPPKRRKAKKGGKKAEDVAEINGGEKKEAQQETKLKDPVTVDADLEDIDEVEPGWEKVKPKRKKSNKSMEAEDDKAIH